MSALLEIRQQLSQASARVASLERALREHPDLPSVAANLESAVKVKRQLEAEFLDVADRTGYDVCCYRVFDEYDKPKAGAAFGAIAAFQRLVSVVYGALKYGEKQRATIPGHIERETAFDLGYAFVGSVGIVLTIRNEKTLVGESDLDRTFDHIVSMAKCKSPDELQEYATLLGSGAINALFQWVAQHTSADLGADIDWRKREHVQRELFMQRHDLSKLRENIERTSSEQVETISVVGVLKMADVDSNRFKLRPEGRPLIKGTMERGAIDELHQASLPRRYLATIRKTTRFKYASGSDEVNYHLLRLREPSQAPGPASA